jgi:hypothetical protein
MFEYGFPPPRIVNSAVLIELAAIYSDAADFLHTSLKSFEWSKIEDVLLVPEVISKNGKKTNLEVFVERLMSGTRMKDVLQRTPDMEQKNIITIIQTLDKEFSRQNFGHQVMPHYEFLCQLAHPNTIGFRRFLTSAIKSPDGWQTRSMEEKSTSERSIVISHECLWALSFGASSISIGFGLFEDLKREYASLASLRASSPPARLN